MKNILQVYTPHYKANLRLAYPVVLSQAGQMLVGIFDSLMVGQLGTIPLAACGLANNIFPVIMVVGMGISMALTPLVGEMYGERNYAKVGVLYRHGLLISLLVGGLLFLGSAGFSPFLHSMDQPEAVVDLALPYFVVICLSLVPLMVFFNGKQFAEGVASTRPAMFITLSSNLLNIILNYLLIYGKLGFPALGLMGAGYATLISRVIMAVVMVAWVKRAKVMQQFWRFEGFKWKKGIFSEIFKLGIPIGGQMVMEVGSFSVGAVMIGTLGASPLAAHQIVIGIAAMTYMMANGLSASATIRTSNFLGAKQKEKAGRAIWSNYHLVIAFMSATALVFVVGRHFLPSLYIDNSEVLDIAAQLMVVAAFFQLFDGIQVMALGALRGMKDVRIPTVLSLIAYWVLGIPSCYFYAFILELGAEGVWYGYLTGLGAIAVLLTFRVYRLLRKISVDARKAGLAVEGKG